MEVFTVHDPANLGVVEAQNLFKNLVTTKNKKKTMMYE